MSPSELQALPNLGDLEIAVLKHLWQVQSATSKAAHEALGIDQGRSLNTVQSAMDRLYRKGLLSRYKRSHAYVYEPKVERDALLVRSMREALERFGGETASALAAFVDQAEDLDDSSLERLEAELARQRQSRIHD